MVTVRIKFKKRNITISYCDELVSLTESVGELEGKGVGCSVGYGCSRVFSEKIN